MDIQPIGLTYITHLLPDSFSFASDPDEHICELQLVHKSMFTARKHCNAHTEYAKFRTALELLETFGLMQTPPHTTDEAQTDGNTSAKELVSEELSEQRAFVEELGSEYDAFLKRYQHMLRITPTDDTLSLENSSSSDERASHDTVMGTVTDLEVEVRRLRNENDLQQQQINDLQQQITTQQNENTSQQNQISSQQMENISQQQQITDQQQQITEQQRQIEQIMLKFKDFEQNAMNTKT